MASEQQTSASNPAADEVQVIGDNVDELGLPEPAKQLIREAIKADVKISPERVLRIWRITSEQQKHIPGLTSTILWVEEGDARSGKLHIVQSHKEDFANKGIPEDKLEELMEATTTVGHPSGFQGKGKKTRPILLLYFHDKPVAVAISVGSNGYLVGMNPSNFEEMRQKAQLTEEFIKEVATWPV